MSNQRMSRNRPLQSDVYERLSQRLEAVAEREGRYSNAVKIALLHEALFGDEDPVPPCGTASIPK